MVCDETKEAGAEVKSLVAIKGTSVILHFEMDIDATFKLAVEARATFPEEVAKCPRGQRYRKVNDPYGFVWSLSTTIKESG